MKILVTGAAGFIGFHLAKRFAARGDEVFGLDNMSDYYDVSLKQARLDQLGGIRNFRFVRIDIADRAAMERLFAENAFDRVVHMAAQAGVRYSLTHPHAYIEANLVGFMNVLECCRHQWQVQGTGMGNSSLRPAPGAVSRSTSPPNSHHLVYASSSSVYGSNTKLPFSVSDNVDHPISLYAATKKANELMAHTYSHLYGIPTTGLRYFTVYGPWGRPDMALFKFTKAILAGEPIDVYNDGKMQRDFTYIDDIVEGVVRVTDHIPGCHPERPACHPERSEGSPSMGSVSLTPCALSPAQASSAPYKIYNIGNHSPVALMDFIGAIEQALDRKAKINFLPMQPGDVPATYADVDDLTRDVGFAPSTPIRDGIARFVEWYRGYYKC